MTPKERQYLRSIYHHYEDSSIRYTNTPDPGELAREWHKYNAMRKMIFFILTMNPESESEELLKDLMEEKKIKIMKKGDTL